MAGYGRVRTDYMAKWPGFREAFKEAIDRIKSAGDRAEEQGFVVCDDDGNRFTSNVVEGFFKDRDSFDRPGARDRFYIMDCVPRVRDGKGKGRGKSNEEKLEDLGLSAYQERWQEVIKGDMHFHMLGDNDLVPSYHVDYTDHGGDYKEFLRLSHPSQYGSQYFCMMAPLGLVDRHGNNYFFVLRRRTPAISRQLSQTGIEGLLFDFEGGHFGFRQKVGSYSGPQDFNGLKDFYPQWYRI